MDVGSVRADGLREVNFPEVTVLMGVFNGGMTLERSIQSILVQTFRNFEFVIIDDASTDGSAEIVRNYAETDKRVRLIRNRSNEGLGAVLRKGVNEARGQLIARMDADDIAHPERLQKQVAFFRMHPDVDVLGTCAFNMDRDGGVSGERKVPTSHDRIVRLVWSCPFVHPTVMFRKESIERVGSYSSNIRRRQDYDLWFRCVKGGLRMANLSDPLLYYHYSEETLRRNGLRAIWDQVKIGLAGCRSVGAPLYAYVGTCLPLIEAVMPQPLRLRLVRLRARVDPRRSG